MKRSILRAVVGTALVALALTVLSACSSNSKHSVFDVVVDDPHAAVAPPDFFTAAPKQNGAGAEDAPVLRNGQKVGLAETAYTFTRVAGDDVVAMIECSVELSDGQLLFNGTAHLADVATGAAVPVVGGTKNYARASGSVVMKMLKDGTTALHFDITIPK